jgi:hypothetical protein
MIVLSVHCSSIVPTTVQISKKLFKNVCCSSIMLHHFSCKVGEREKKVFKTLVIDLFYVMGTLSTSEKNTEMVSQKYILFFQMPVMGRFEPSNKGYELIV